MTPRYLMSSILLSSLMMACSSAKFAGNSGANANDGKQPESVQPQAVSADPSLVSVPTIAPGALLPTCADGVKITGARIAFVIDNSGSNSSTDCPTRSATGTTNFLDQLRYACGGPTARESAVLDAYDLLAQVAAKAPGDPMAESQMAIASFPTAGNQSTGWQKQIGWRPMLAAARGEIANSLLFTRSPGGLTPYSAAVTAASTLFVNVSKDDRQNVVILISDGQATDGNPADVEAKAAALKASGVKVYVIIYGGTLAENASSQVELMQRLQNSNKASSQGNWYSSNYASFDDYIKKLVGVNGQGGLAANVAGDGHLIEIKSANNLSETVRSLVSTQALKCSAR